VTSYAPWDADTARSIIAAKRAMPGALLPILHALQEEFGYIDRAADPLIAEILNLTRAEVHGVVTFYHDFTMTFAALRRAGTCLSFAALRLARRLAATRLPATPSKKPGPRSATPPPAAVSAWSRSIVSAYAPLGRLRCSTAA
jgi:formate dehydrogenase subunit gamma